MCLKKIIVGLVLVCILMTSAACSDTGSEDILPTVTSIGEINESMLQVEFVADGWISHTQSPGETWRKKTGDCEDYAWLALELLNQIGVEGYVLEVYCKPKYPMPNHAVCIFKDDELTNGKYWFYSNSILRKTDCDKLEEAVYRVRIKSWVIGWKLINSDGKVVQRG